MTNYYHRCAAGLFLGPQMVGEALKGGRLVAEVMFRLGNTVVPSPGAQRTLQSTYKVCVLCVKGRCHPNSFITAVELGSPEAMKTFCQALQSCAPVGAYIRPEP
eukprot:scaffold493956_cov39-Prasinocladus_malaysianus.AAC.1